MPLLPLPLLMLGLATCALAPRPPPHMAPSPPQVLPQLDGSSFPAFRTVFQNGECDMDDPPYDHHPGGPGSGPIALKKRCYSCFRIPAIVRNFHTGTIHAFAEARRGDLGDLPAFHGMMSSASDPAVLCPDIPDTSLAYKRSTDGGLTFGSLKILDEVLGRCRGQPTPVVDNVTQELFLAFNDGCNPGAKGVRQGPMIMSSKDDGLRWSNASKIVCNDPPCTGGTMPAYVVPGDSRGMVTATAAGSGNSSVRLWIPSWSGPMFSDSHGATWSLAGNPGGPKLQNGGAGENSITKFSNSTFNGYVMMMRCENEAKVPGCKGAYASISFSKDMLTWTPRTPVTGLNPWIQGAADQNSVLGVKGGLVFTHGGCTPGSRAPACLNATSSAARLRGGGNRRRLSGGNGMKLLFSPDGFTWRLLETLWPFDGGYSTLGAIEIDEHDGSVLRYMTFFEAGGIFSGRQALVFNNFTVPTGGYK
jgi:hypothetical protein